MTRFLFNFHPLNVLSYENFNFEIKKGVPMLIEENAPFWHYVLLIIRIHSQ